ncbi:mitochondrial intermembrane space translocase subunit [Durotheca rogersii]|uniref:mitochondrial intermembrane space translocase subunit n=1 Tax=Durotheca rogersii TaxID=419775 RepID=UPI0022201CF4|nr:mitochondrial intermembrane space translocase subunit [Durotheca rogersii]KAI5860515.1 mitochondrial intermembrane space translocase subunit [Durotheca rogersii]
MSLLAPAVLPCPLPAATLTAAESRELEQRMQKQQMKVFFGRPQSNRVSARARLRPNQLFSNLVDHCFMSCIDDFTSKSLSSRESGCVARCVQKHMALSQRLSERFQEHNAQMTQQQQQQGGGGLR